MVVEIVKQAVHIKMRCTTRNDLLSPAEVAYGAAYAIQRLGADDMLKDQLKLAVSVGDIFRIVRPFINPYLENHGMGSEMDVLLTMLMDCKLDGQIKEDERTLMQIGFDV